MQRVVATIPRNGKVFLLGDTHLGTVFFHQKGLGKLVDQIASDNRRNRWIHVGDWIEAITSDDRRYDSTIALYKNPSDQAKAITDIFRPIAGQGIVGLMGNHERTLFRVKDFADSICTDLHIPYGTSMCRVVLQDKKERHLFNLFCCHGYWLFKSQAKDPEQEKANKLASMKMRLKKLSGDSAVMICGHAHELMVAEPVEQLYITDAPDGVQQNYLGLPDDLTGGYIPPDQRFYGCCGSLRKNQMDGFTDYAEGFAPIELGCLILDVEDGRPKRMYPFKV